MNLHTDHTHIHKSTISGMCLKEAELHVLHCPKCPG